MTILHLLLYIGAPLPCVEACLTTPARINFSLRSAYGWTVFFAACLSEKDDIEDATEGGTESVSRRSAGMSVSVAPQEDCDFLSRGSENRQEEEDDEGDNDEELRGWEPHPKPFPPTLNALTGSAAKHQRRLPETTTAASSSLRKLEEEYVRERAAHDRAALARQLSSLSEIRRGRKSQRRIAAFLCALLDRLRTHPQEMETVDWRLKDRYGRDFLSMLAEEGLLSMVWALLQAYQVPFFTTAVHPQPFLLSRAIRERDWVRLSVEDKQRFAIPMGLQYEK